MAINKNHEFEELDGVKCAIVEKNASPERVEFLKRILSFNKFTVIVVPTPAAKAAAKPVVENADLVESTPVVDETPKSFTVGVSDYTFNVINALFGRSLKTEDGHIVTPAFWAQKESVSHDEVPYYEFKE